jgi:hypothetical protein
VSKKLSRSKRKELRDKGELEPTRPAERRRTEDAYTPPRSTAARAPEPREEIADDEPVEAAPKKAAGRDRTVLVLVALTAAAALIFWLTQRSPTKETKIDVPAPTPPAAGSAKP